MSTWHEQQRPVWPLYAGLVLVTLAILIGMLLTWGLPGDDGSTAERSPSATPTATLPSDTPAASPSASPAGDPTKPEVVSWGGNGDQLAIVVRNASDRFIRKARVQIVARDGGGRTILATTGDARSTCCTVLGLPPGEDFGLFAFVPSSVAEVDEVEVRYVSMESRPARSRGTRVETTHARLELLPDDAVVAATLTADGPVHGFVSGQAFLEDRRGHLTAVISGRFYCFADGTSRQVRMELLRPLPRGTRIRRVLARPIPTGIPAHVGHTCS